MATVQTCLLLIEHESDLRELNELILREFGYQVRPVSPTASSRSSRSSRTSPSFRRD